MRVSLSALITTSHLLTLTTAQAPVKDGAAVVFGAGGTYPRAVRLSDGSLLGTYTHNADANHTLVTVKSTNNGQTWTTLGTIDTWPSAQKDLDNPYVHQMPNGHILAAFRNHDLGNGAGNDPTHYRITVCKSEDLGGSWKYLSTPLEMPGGPDGPWEPFMQTGLDGNIQLYYSKETGAGGQDSIVRESTTNGQTWTAERTFTGQNINNRDGMLGVAHTAEGSQTKVAIFESGVGPHFDVWTVLTKDDGKTWEPTRYSVYGGANFNAGAPQIIRVGNKLVASFETNESGGTWPTGAMAVMVSTNGGTSWGNKVIVHAAPAMWPGMVALDDTSFLALYESGGTSYAQRMKFA